MVDDSDASGSADRVASDGRVSRTLLIVGVIAGLAVGGIAGVVIGWKLEQNRVKEDIKSIRPVGEVTAVNEESFTIDLKASSGSRTYAITDETVVDRARSGDVADVVEGATVLVRTGNNDGQPEAIEIVVLPDSTKLGS